MSDRGAAKWVPLAPDTLGDFRREALRFLGRAKPVFIAGEGPAVIVLHELPGITPEVARFARRVRDAGFTVFMPQLAGVAGRPFDGGYVAREALKVCISREFAVFAAGRASPVVDWLRALARHAHAERGGPGVGAIGMCLTGNFALTMTLEPAVRAPALLQPSLPLQGGPGLHAAPETIAAVKARLEAEDLSLFGCRFAGDRLCPAARFEALRAAFGERFEAIEVPDDAAAPHPLAPHSPLTNHLIDAEGEPTREALERILGFLRRRLHPHS